jgi:Phosphotransferase enzyme family
MVQQTAPEGLDALAEEARRFLTERADELIAGSQPICSVEVRSEGTALVGTIHAQIRRRCVVLKPTWLNTHVRDAHLLSSALRTMALADPRIADALPRVLGVTAAGRVIALEYVDGERLVTRFRRDLASYGEPPSTTVAVLEQAGRVLAAVHRLAATDVIGDSPVRRHASFVGPFLDRARRFASSFRRAGVTPESLVARLPADFAERSGDRLVLVDARPKNLIVRPDGGIAFIDLDCTALPAAYGVGTFLAAIDRSSSRYTSRRQQRHVAIWKRAFVTGYFTEPAATVAEDLMFFYPFVLMQMHAQHTATHAWLAPYFQWYYGRRLEWFLSALHRLPAADITARPAALFSIA